MHHPSNNKYNTFRLYLQRNNILYIGKLQNYKYHKYTIMVMKAIGPDRQGLFRCEHGPVSEVVVDGEVVCRVCGVVQGADVSREMSLRTRGSLYLELETGGKPLQMPGGRYVRGNSSDLTVISNITQNLGIGNRVGGDAWRWYQRLRKSPIPLTKAKSMVLAFHGVCRCHGVALDGQQLTEAIQIYLGVKNAPSYLKSVMEASSHLVDGEMTLKRIGYMDLSKDKRFGLHSGIRPLNEQYTVREVEGIAGVAQNIQGALSGPRTARVAIRMAKRRCGV